ncbi:efflux RND transporter periplasmic adaptor subunit [Ideonella livida]|uniref:Efflux RND transporter periplasmic adaptor subunit n=1 Tax=Ideonella livida TaxID=2707176 RepID=A0A7C9THD0_9BURK|nr:efflux RND transporter periplasmic adaptor subunit [Ideonella livida]NDY90380.1 efflux RND transporter periplasmic adaptor subunit [Ideonella livida]
MSAAAPASPQDPVNAVALSAVWLRRRPLSLLAAAALLSLVALAGCQKSGAQTAPAGGAKPAAPVTVGVVTLATQTVGLSTELPGRVAAPVVAEIRPQVRGLIRSRNFVEGGTVKAGQVLYEIEPDSYRVALASAQASVDRAQATLEAARLTAQRRAELMKVEAVSQQDLQDAQVAVKQAEADLASAKATRDSAQLNLSRTQVTSPIGGRVDVSSVTPGALVTADQATVLTTVRQTDPVQVDISQSSAELLRLKRDFATGKLQKVGAEDARIRLVLEDGSVYPLPGKLRMAGVSVNTTTGAVTLRAQFPNPQGDLMPGMYVRAQLETGSVPEGLQVPQQALSRDSRGAASVLVVDAAGVVERRAVTVNRAYGNAWLVSGGLKAGERVIVEGSQKVKAGDTVQVHPVGTGGTGAPAANGAAPATAAASAASR